MFVRPLTLALISAMLLGPVQVSAQQYILLAWNDLGMHCANKDFSAIAVLPPYNTVYAQLIRKTAGESPEIVTAGYSVSYSIPGNTYSAGKTNFWTYAQQLFGLSQPLPPNVGLTGRGLSGTMDTSGTHFIAVGIPLTPYSDDDLMNEKPFQLVHLVAQNVATGDTVATTDAVIPVSNEIGCVQSGCHSSVAAIVNEHEDAGLTTPVLCASCHASNALGTIGDPEAAPLSYRIHSTHSWITPRDSVATCYKCHPGPNTRCLRDIMGRNPVNPLACQSCHGTMAQIAYSITTGRRPWLDEPRCGNTTCHGSGHSEEPNTLYRMSRGHGGLFCSACHGSPHAIQPTVQPNDNLQNIRLQGFAGPLSDCSVCHTVPPTGPGPHGLLPGSQVTSHIAIAQGWNLLSVPVSVTDPRRGTLFPTAVSNAFTYVPDSGYVVRDSLLNRDGYWMRFSTVQTVNITGLGRSQDTVDVVAGWNLFGTITSPVSTGSILQMPSGIVSSGYYGFGGSGYAVTTTLQPGSAYWVRASIPGRLVLVPSRQFRVQNR